MRLYGYLCATPFAVLSLGGTALAADSHVIVARANLTWTYNGQASTPAKPIMVNDLKVGDIVDIQIPGGQHGFITIKKVAAASTEITEPVLACGEAPASKPNAVLRELECGAATRFGIAYTGSLKFEVLATFKEPVDFWCWVHKKQMPGTLSLKPTK